MPENPKLSDLLNAHRAATSASGEPVSWPAEHGGITYARALAAAQAIDRAPVIVGFGFDPEAMLDLASYVLGYDIRSEGSLVWEREMP